VTLIAEKIAETNAEEALPAVQETFMEALMPELAKFSPDMSIEKQVRQLTNRVSAYARAFRGIEQTFRPHLVLGLVSRKVRDICLRVDGQLRRAIADFDKIC